MIEQVRAAGAHQTPLHIRGGGSKNFHGPLPQGERLDTRDWRGIVSHEPTELVVTVRAGTPLAVTGLQEIIANPACSTAVGLLMVGAESRGPVRTGPVRDNRQGLFARMKAWFQGNF